MLSIYLANTQMAQEHNLLSLDVKDLYQVIL